MAAQPGPPGQTPPPQPGARASAGKDWNRGTVKNWHGNKHFGFIVQSDGTDVFCHQSNLVVDQEMASGTPVCYMLQYDESKGKYSAYNVMEEILDLSAPPVGEEASRRRERGQSEDTRPAAGGRHQERNSWEGSDRRSWEDGGDRKSWEDGRDRKSWEDKGDRKSWEDSSDWKRQGSWEDQGSWERQRSWDKSGSWAEDKREWSEDKREWPKEESAAPREAAEDGAHGFGPAKTPAGGHDSRAEPY